MKKFLLLLVLLAGCGGIDLTDMQKYEMAKQCVDAGMWPDVLPSRVLCMAVPKSNSHE